MNDYENIFTTEDINIISTIKDNMSPLTYHYFRVTVTDTFDYQTKGPIYTSLLETYPTPSQINSIKYSYEKESFEIYWTKNTDNDFKSYYINESENEDMSNEKEITQINDQNIEYFEVSNDPGLTRYYQLIVEDNYGLKSNSDIKIGKSFEIFTQTFGGVSSDPDYGMYGHQTSDGGYIITGRVRNNNIYHDMLLIKTNSKGTKEWDYTHGSPGKEDSGVFTKQTIDGGYILLGETESEGNGKLDYSLIKVTSLGNHDWRNLFGGVDYDKPFSLDETTDGGFIIVGSTRSFCNGTIDGNDKDLWLIKTSSSGSEEWKKTFGTQNMDFDDEGVSVQQTTDGGYIITGHTRQSYDPEQIWLLKTDSNGNEEWNKTFGDDSEAEFGKSVKQTIDGGYIILGYTSGGGSFGDNDIWLIKTDSQGNQEWLREFGDGKDDTGFSIDITTDGGYIIVGHTYYRNSYDIWLIKTDSQGTEQWNKKFGGPGNDFGRSVQQTSDGGYFITGTVDSGNHDIWIIKTDPEGNIE